MSPDESLKSVVADLEEILEALSSLTEVEIDTLVVAAAMLVVAGEIRDMQTMLRQRLH